MDKNLPDIEDLFKSALENEEEMPEPKVWNAIDNMLDKDNVISIKKKYNILKKVAFLLLVMVLWLGVYEIEKPSDSRFSKASSTRDKSSKKINFSEPASGNDSIHSTVAEPSNYGNNESKKRPEHLAVIEKSTTKPESAEGSVAMANNHKGQRNDRQKSFRNRFYSAKQMAFVNAATADKVKAGKAWESSLSGEYMTKYDKHVISDVSTFSVAELNLVKSYSVHPVAPPHSSGSIYLNLAVDEKNSISKIVKMRNKKPSPFSLNPFFSPDVASYRLEDNAGANNLNDANEFEKNEKHELSLTMGALVEYRMSKHWSLQSGLTFSNTNITVAPQTIYAHPDNRGTVKYLLNTSSGVGYVLPSFSQNPAVGDSLYAFTSSHTLQYISLPAAIKYNITKGKFIVYTMAASALNYLVKGKVETSVEDATNNEPEALDNLQGLKKIYFSGLAGVGVDYLLNKKIFVTFSPTYRFAINPINKEASVKSFPNSAGLAAGVRFNF